MRNSDIFVHIRSIFEAARKRLGSVKLTCTTSSIGVLYVVKPDASDTPCLKSYPNGVYVMLTLKSGALPLLETMSISSSSFQKLVKQLRRRDKRKGQTSFCIVDAQSVKMQIQTRKKSYDAGKKERAILGVSPYLGIN